MKKILLLVSVCVLCITAQAQVVKGVTRTGQIGTYGANIPFVNANGRIVTFPALTSSGQMLNGMLPSVTTSMEITDRTTTSAKVSGTLLSNGADDNTVCGICYGTEANPNVIQNAKVEGTVSETGTFTVELTGLQPNTTYHVRAYATNAIGTNYGADVTFTTIGVATVTITGKSESKTYNGSEQSVTGYTVTIPDGVNIAETEISYAGNASATGTTVGTYPLTYAASDFSCSNTNYDVTFTVTDGALTITKAAAEVTANNATKVYGESDPNLTATVTGTINNDALNYTLARTEGEDAGTYAITVTLGDNPNYDVTATNGTFTITKATATVQAPVIYINYGEAVPTFTATETGVLGDDHLNYTLNLPTSFENHGGTAWAIAVQLGENPNYEISATDGLLTIKRIAASITVVNKSKVYGATDPELTATVTGTINGDELNYTLARATGENVGDYAITVTKGINNDYEVTVTNGTLTITPAAATVKADDKTKVAGESDPTFTATVTGLKNNDAATVITYTFSRTQGETVGNYTITPSGDATQGNYNVTYQTGTLTITEPPCPTLGTTTYTPNPVTSSATTITLTTPVNNVTTGVTVSNPQYTATMDNTPVTVSNVSYSNGTMTGTITITTAMGGNAITVTPAITTAGCENPGTLTGDAVEICVPYATKPSITAVSHTPSNPMGKSDLFNYEGVTLSATVSNYSASQVESRGFLISTNQSDIQSYDSDFAVAGGTISSDNTFKTASKLGLSYCGKKWYYRAFIKMNGCEDPVLSSINSFQMWGPESATSSSVAGPTVSATPNSVAAGQTVTLNATAYMTVGTGNLGTHPLEEWMHYSDYSWYPGDLSITYQFYMPYILDSYGITEQSWTYRWEDENGTEIYSDHTSGTTTVTPTQTTTYTAFGEFLYGGEVCRVSKSVTVTVQ